MSDYNKYVTAINTIFDCVVKIKAGWNSVENNNHAEKIEEFRQLVTKEAETLKNSQAKVSRLEALGND